MPWWEAILDPTPLGAGVSALGAILLVIVTRIVAKRVDPVTPGPAPLDPEIREVLSMVAANARMSDERQRAILDELSRLRSDLMVHMALNNTRNRE